MFYREGLCVNVLQKVWKKVDLEKFYITKVSSLITSFREFNALYNCRNYPLLPKLLSGEHLPGKHRDDLINCLGSDYVEYLEKHFNESQREAITAAATSTGFTLIKGNML